MKTRHFCPRLKANEGDERWNYRVNTSARKQTELELLVLRHPSPLITTVESCIRFTPAFCFHCKYFVSISQQICHSETQRRNASVGHYRDGTFQSFVLRWLLRAAASNRPFFISHLVVWGVTARPSQSITRIPSPRPPSLPSWLPPFSKGTCTLFNVHSPRRQCPTWPLTPPGEEKAGLIWCWDPLLPLSERQGTQCGSRLKEGGVSVTTSAHQFVCHILPPTTHTQKHSPPREDGALSTCLLTLYSPRPSL